MHKLHSQAHKDTLVISNMEGRNSEGVGKKIEVVTFEIARSTRPSNRFADTDERPTSQYSTAGYHYH